MLQIKDIRKQYITGDLVQTALDGVSLSIDRGEFVAIVGQSGSVNVSKDGGQIEAITGATITSRAICVGINAALDCVGGLG